jgi:hypothetical protein
MRVRSMILAATMALAAPSALHAADMSGYYPVGPSCANLQPVDTYVPPQVAYIVACTVALPEPVYTPGEHGHGHGLFAMLGHGHGKHGGAEAMTATPIGPYGPHATHDAARYEGKLVYLQQWSADRPPVHFLVVPK